MKIRKNNLIALIENYLFEDEKSVSLKNSQRYTASSGMTGENVLVKDVKFKWGAYKGKHANEKYVILQGETELGNFQKKGDPFTYKQLKDGTLKIISGPASFDSAIGKLTRQKNTTDPDDNKSTSDSNQSGHPVVEDFLVEDFLSFKDIEKLQKLIVDRDRIVSILKSFKGSIQLKAEKSNLKTNITFGKDDLGLVKNSPPRLIIKHWYKSSSGNDIKKYNAVLDEIMKITYEMHIEMLNNLREFLDMGQDGGLFATSRGAEKYINLANNYVKKYYSLIYKICNEIPDNINAYWKYAIEQNKSSESLLKDKAFSNLVNAVLKLLNSIAAEPDETKRNKKIYNLLPYLQDSIIS